MGEVKEETSLSQKLQQYSVVGARGVCSNENSRVASARVCRTRVNGGMLASGGRFVSSCLRNPWSRDNLRERGREERRKEGRKRRFAEEVLLNRPARNPAAALLAFTRPRRKLCGTRHDEDDGAKNRWPTERQNAGPVPAAASHSDSVAGVFGHLRLAACHHSLRLVFHRHLTLFFASLHHRPSPLSLSLSFFRAKIIERGAKEL